MSCPTGLASFKDGVVTGTVYHNWGWVSPTDQEVALRIIKIVEKVYSFSSGELGKDWDILKIHLFGTLAREKYYDMYDTMKAIHYGKYDAKDFNLYNFVEAF
ncbi:Hypothetical protein KNT65_gp141 [Escherichia phage EcS1]|uniref:Uncharacterized protein n=1 Tax=Escherichia phage EcS1 TaxID=2083276 RepID=A0A2Z5ZC38_9CAUD|nr:Hypothetical protein KNT65_gp141 [Escherichia phage EcS1]BBC78189.1 Hypothetical protein [Escherichia phage EcS1]